MIITVDIFRRAWSIACLGMMRVGRTGSDFYFRFVLPSHTATLSRPDRLFVTLVILAVFTVFIGVSRICSLIPQPTSGVLVLRFYFVSDHVLQRQSCVVMFCSVISTTNPYFRRASITIHRLVSTRPLGGKRYPKACAAVHARRSCARGNCLLLVGWSVCCK